ncbi:MAG: FkbM family methyltransferase [Planctomycetota bacterium]
MATLVGQQLKRRFALPYACYKLVFKREAFIRESGWLESIRACRPCGRDGQPIPWMNYNVVEFFDERLTDQLSVFEFGSGYSTSFFASRCRDVLAVEHDMTWQQQVQQMLPANASVMHCDSTPDGSYCRAASQQRASFHVVIVDGRDRVNCVRHSLRAMAADGVLVLDDSDRERYSDAFPLMRQHGFRHLHFSGIKPGKSCRNQTTIFYRDKNCLGL